MHRQLGDGPVAPDRRHRHLRLERCAVLLPCPLHVLLPRYPRFLGAGLHLSHLSRFRGPAHSIIGPIAVRGAEPGDVVEIRYKRLHPANWGAVFNNPASLGTGLLPQDFSEGQIKYVDLDLAAMQGKFAPDINIPLTPFQGTLGSLRPTAFSRR